MNLFNRYGFSIALVGCLLFNAPCQAQATPTEEAEASESVEELDIPEADSTAADAQPDPADAAPERDPNAKNPAPADPSLLPVYKDFGELAGLTALMEDFMTRLVADQRTRRFFENSDQVALKKHLVEQFCVILGGPCTYTGRDMITAHKGFNIERSHFYALVEVLQQSMDARKIPFRSQNKLLAKLAPMHREIEGR